MQIVLSAGQLLPKDDKMIRLFKLNIPDDDLRDQKTRLSKARYVDHITGTHFNSDFKAEHLKKVIEYWRSTYNWKKEEAKINAYPRFQTQIERLIIFSLPLLVIKYSYHYFIMTELKVKNIFVS